MARKAAATGRADLAVRRLWPNRPKNSGESSIAVNLNRIGRGSSSLVVAPFPGCGAATDLRDRAAAGQCGARLAMAWTESGAGGGASGGRMPGKPYVVVTRKLPDSIETRMMELFQVKLNLGDQPLSQAALIEAVKT